MATCSQSGTARAVPIAAKPFNMVRRFASGSTKSAARPGKVTFVFKNTGHVLHDFSIRGKKTPLTQPGKTAKLVVSFTKKGKYGYLCTVPGHAQAGMKGTFTVR